MEATAQDSLTASVSSLQKHLLDDQEELLSEGKGIGYRQLIATLAHHARGHLASLLGDWRYESRRALTKAIHTQRVDDLRRLERDACGWAQDKAVGMLRQMLHRTNLGLKQYTFHAWRAGWKLAADAAASHATLTLHRQTARLWHTRKSAVARHVIAFMLGLSFEGLGERLSRWRRLARARSFEVSLAAEAAEESVWRMGERATELAVLHGLREQVTSMARSGIIMRDEMAVLQEKAGEEHAVTMQQLRDHTQTVTEQCREEIDRWKGEAAALQAELDRALQYNRLISQQEGKATELANKAKMDKKNLELRTLWEALHQAEWPPKPPGWVHTAVQGARQERPGDTESRVRRGYPPTGPTHEDPTPPPPPSPSRGVLLAMENDSAIRTRRQVLSTGMEARYEAVSDLAAEAQDALSIRLHTMLREGTPGPDGPVVHDAGSRGIDLDLACLPRSTEGSYPPHARKGDTVHS